MKIPRYMVNGIFIILLSLIIIQLVREIYIATKNKILKVFIIITSIIAIIGSIVLCLFIIFITVFTYTPEHIIEKENKKMVAYVYSFLQVRVEYYDYVNIFVRGNKLKIEEDYGSGGYDPFEREIVPLPERYTYYDDNGKVIKSNW